MTNEYGYFSEDGQEYIINTPKTPRPFDNFLWNNSIIANVQQTGVGYTDYQIGEKEMTKLSTGIGRICDFDVFGRESFMNRIVYVRDNTTGQFWNIGWEPVKTEYESFECRHGIGYTTIQNKTSGVEGTMRMFVPVGEDPVELWTLQLQAEGKRDLSVFVYTQISFMYMWGFNSYGDMFYRNSQFNRDHNMMVFTKHPFVTPHNFQTGFLAADKPVSGSDGSRDFFVGTYNALKEPEAVVNGRCRDSIGSSDATIAVLQFDLPEFNHAETINLVFGVSDNIDNAAALKNRYLVNIEDEFTKLRNEKQEMAAHNTMSTPDRIFNAQVNSWNKQQALLGAQWCRWGWMGYRDIVQHGMGVSNFRPGLTRNIILKALRHQYSHGLALRGWNPVDTKEYSDSALWLVFTLSSYLKETGDFELLDIDVPFYDKDSASVVEHIDRALDFLESNKGIHNLLLIKFGDWNDSLTGIGKEGRGESVWLSMAYAEALRQMGELCSYLGNSAKVENYQNRYSTIIEAINTHAWDGEWYLRGFCDDGQPIGSSINQEGRIYLNVQSWAMICGAADRKRMDTILQSVDRMLDTPLGYKLITPAYQTFNPVIGRVTSMEPGICENGTVYAHGNAFFIKGLYAMGERERAFSLYRKVTPAYPNSEDCAKKKNPGYVYANCYYGPEHRNSPYKMEFAWITGSIGWFYNSLYEDMLGIKREYGGLKISPALPRKWNQMQAVRIFRNKRIDIEITGTGMVSEIFLNGNKIDLPFIPVESLAETNALRIILCEKTSDVELTDSEQAVANA